MCGCGSRIDKVLEFLVGVLMVSGFFYMNTNDEIILSVSSVIALMCIGLILLIVAFCKE